MNMRGALAFGLAFLMPVAAEAAPLLPTVPLYKAIKAADAALFGAANHCDKATFAKYLTEDVEFYHDKAGKEGDKADVVQRTMDTFCNNKMVRELVPASLEVYPLPNFGAIEIGTHRFLHPGDPKNVGEGRFLQIWQLQNGAWKASRIISYDH
jgi:hypothetical protein